MQVCPHLEFQLFRVLYNSEISMIFRVRIIGVGLWECHLTAIHVLKSFSNLQTSYTWKFNKNGKYCLIRGSFDWLFVLCSMHQVFLKY